MGQVGQSPLRYLPARFIQLRHLALNFLVTPLGAPNVDYGNFRSVNVIIYRNEPGHKCMSVTQCNACLISDRMSVPKNCVLPNSSPTVAEKDTN